MIALTTDRRLYVTADRSRIVEEGHPDGSWLLYSAGRAVGKGDADRYSMIADEHGRIVYNGCPTLPAIKAPEGVEDVASEETSEVEDEASEEASAEESEEVDSETAEASVEDSLAGDGTDADAGDHSDRNTEPLAEWPGRSTPAAYLKRYPTGPKAELAQAHVDAGADGEA